ncbi:MAG: CDP-diacylglycerol--glycerol-3-phosphate 3-phosphatidyltransferase [Candidatus Omnitrophica bacterium]|nr:CDP-diacylglycerol--glycerol-3-phosphate 3-phosphatidyltransferase [Candidatus Omnitrophota bacterium]
MIWSGNFKEAHKDIPNAVSLLRALIGVSIPFFLFHHQPYFHWVAFILFLLGAFTDFVDGYIARSFSWESSFGKIIDPTADKVLILVPLGTFAFLGLYSVWWIVPIFVREIVITFCRIAWSLEGRIVGAEKIGKLKLCFQVGAVIFAHLYYLSFHHLSLLAYHHQLHWMMMISMIFAVVLTTLSGISFFANNQKNMKTVSFAKFTVAVGVGLLPLAPGTWGSLAGLLLVMLLQFNWIVYGVTFFALMGAGFWAASKLDLVTERDPGYVVMDEVLGMMLAFFLIPFNPVTALTGFFIFRGFDIAKPFPLKHLERLPGFWGILLDDLGAGIYTWILLWVLSRSWVIF